MMLLFCFCTNINEIINTTKQDEAFILVMGQDHLIVDNNFMFSTETLLDALINIICYCYVLNIAYPKPMFALFIFLQHFIFGLI